MSYSTVENSFCRNCENFMDITNSISNIDPNKLGGDINDIQDSSDYDVSLSESNDDTNSISESNVNGILNGHNIDINLKNFDINELNKNPTFNKLTNNQKTLVINRILEKVPKQKTLKNADNVNKELYFYCKSCGYNEKIPNKQFIFSRGNEKREELYNYNFLNYIHDNTLPRTKNYNCINDKCLTHQNNSLKMAVFYRHRGTYNIKYICTVCNNYWNTFVEK